MLDTDRLIDALDLAELATQAGAKLHKAGRQLRSTCPLHAGSDNPTSFCVHTPKGSGRQLWVCHKCGGGDALAFIMRWRGLEFIDAVKWAAQEARIPLTDLGLTEEAVKEHQVREKRRDILDVAARFYQRQFRKSSVAIAYALGRAFTPRTLTRFGFSTGRGLGEYLQRHNADLALAREMGLLRSDGFDFTANHDGQRAAPTGWLIYLHRRAGRRVDYVSARAIKPVDPDDKSRNLPGHKQLYRCEAEGDKVVLVEGQADAETLRQIGVSAWALCGTSLDDDADLAALRRRKVYLALDDDTHRLGDEALTESRAQSQAARQQKLADKLGPLTLISTEIPVAGVKDLNEWLQREPDLSAKTITNWLSQAHPWIDHRITIAAGVGPLEQAEHICEVAHLLARLPEPLKGKWYKRAAKELDMTPAELRGAAGQDGHGPAAEIKDGQLCIYGMPLLTGAAWITRELTLSDGYNAPKVQYLIAGRLKSGEPLHELQVEAAEFDGLSWMSEWGARLIKLVGRGRYFDVARAIQEISLSNNGSSMKRENVFAHTGLATINGEPSFLTKTGRLTVNGLDPAVRVDLGEFSRLSYALPDPPRGEALRAAAAAAIAFLEVAPLRITAPLFAAMCAAPLTSVRPLNTVLWVYGTTTTGKSIVVHLAISFFAPAAIRARGFEPMIGWNSTLTTIEAAMFAAKDLPLCIDDYAPQFQSPHDALALRGTADKVIRSLGNRMARGRSRSDESVRRVRNPRALVLATAENPIEGQSLNHRLVYIGVEPGDVIKPEENRPLDQAEEQGAAGLYAQAMSAFVRWLLTDWAKHAEQFGTMVDADVISSRAEFAKGMDRQPDYFAILNSAQRLALKAWSEMGALDPERAGQLAEANRRAILEVVQGQAGRIGEQSPAIMFLRAVDSLLDQRRCYLAPRRAMSDWAPPDKAERIGWFDPADHGAIWLHSENSLAVAKGYWDRLNINFDVSRESLKRLMGQSGLLRATGDDKRVEISIWTGHRTERALEVDVAKVLANEQLGIDLTYPRPYDAQGDPAEARKPLPFYEEDER